MFNYLGVMYLSFDEWRKNVLLCCNFNLIFRKSGVENVLNVEICLCFLEYDGQFCEQCVSGYMCVMLSGGFYVMCVLCQCNGYLNFCYFEIGVCMEC